MSNEESLLEAIRDDYGVLRVTESEGYRFLYFGEQTEQSCCFEADPAWLEYDYTRAMLLALYWQNRPQQVTCVWWRSWRWMMFVCSSHWKQ